MTRLSIDRHNRPEVEGLPEVFLTINRNISAILPSYRHDKGRHKLVTTVIQDSINYLFRLLLSYCTCR